MFGFADVCERDILRLLKLHKIEKVLLKSFRSLLTYPSAHMGVPWPEFPPNYPGVLCDFVDSLFASVRNALHIIGQLSADIN